MRKLAIALGVTAAMLLGGSLTWKADATTLSSGTVNLPSAAKNYSPVEKGRLLPDWPVWSRLAPGVRSDSLLVCALPG